MLAAVLSGTGPALHLRKSLARVISTLCWPETPLQPHLTLGTTIHSGGAGTWWGGGWWWDAKFVPVCQESQLPRNLGGKAKVLRVPAPLEIGRQAR